MRDRGRMAPQPAELPRRATALRLVHTGIAAAELAALGHVWVCALTGRRDRGLAVSAGALAAEGVALVIGRGNCPLGPLQRRLGDPVPLFELVLPPRAAKAAVPVLTAAALAGLAVVAVRGIGGDEFSSAGRSYLS
ncbi:hypothetical protein SAMN04515669_3067 [Jiangella sp. DSM 45060]|nr:hypothetical protein SAMN04515669_3067 [Jiangella sp. DSM 45060]